MSAAHGAACAEGPAVAGDRSPTLRDEVLAELRQASARFPSGIGAIFVHKGLLEGFGNDSCIFDPLWFGMNRDSPSLVQVDEEAILRWRERGN